MAKSPVISFKKVTKNYGKSRGIKAVDLDVDAGEIFGFLGPNGAGKTTSISIMVDLIRPTKGKVSIFGLDSVKDSLEIHKRIGFLMDDMALDKDLTGWQQLEYFGNLRGSFNKAYVRELATRFKSKLDVRFKNLSRGNRQKVALISALMHDPELLILDEPTSGLDPLMQAEFNKIILERKAKGKTAFISSHILSEVQELCDQVAFIREGEIIATRQLEEIGKDAQSLVKIRTNDNQLANRLKRISSIKNLTITNSNIAFTFSGNINDLIKLLGSTNIKHLTIQDSDLETTFMNYYKG